MRLLEAYAYYCKVTKYNFRLVKCWVFQLMNFPSTIYLSKSNANDIYSVKTCLFTKQSRPTINYEIPYTWWKKTPQTLNPVIMVYFLANHIYLPPLLHLQKRLIIGTVIFSGRLREIYLLKTDNTRKSFMFVHVSSHCFQWAKFRFFFHFVKLLTFECPWPKNPQVKDTLSQVKICIEQKEVSDTCRISEVTIDKKVILPVITGWVP